MNKTPEQLAGVVPDRPNHERGCIFRYGAIPDSGEYNCSCKHKDDPDWIADPWRPGFGYPREIA